MNKITRDLEVRATEERPVNTWTPAALLPQPKPRPCWVHMYKRFAMMGAADPVNFSAARREGWEPIKLEDYPELLAHAAVASEGQFKGSLEIGGLVLCRQPEEMAKQRTEYYNKMAESQMASVDNNFMRENDPRMPLFKDKSTKVTFGSGK